MAVLVLLLFVAAIGNAREFTDRERASFPKLFHLDDYERCLAQRDGLYCLGTFDLSPADLPHPTFELLKAYSEEAFHFNRTRIHRGYCVSARCPIYADMSGNASHHFEHNASLRFEHCVDSHAQARRLRASLNTFHYCRTHAETTTKQLPTNAERIFTQVIYVIIVLNIIGTIYDINTKDGTNKNKLLSAFSIPSNWRQLTSVHEGGDPRLTALVPIHGTRVIALGFTTYAHANILQYTFYIFNPEFLEQFPQRGDGIYLSTGTSLIQGFVMISCFLTGYNLLIYSQKHELSLHMLPLCILKRVIRITPVHLLIIGFAATWWMHTRDGPLVSTTIGLESDACKTKFWSHMFYVSNIIDKKDYCVAPTWFLSVDMHLYIVACILTLLLWRRRCTAVKLYAVLFVASCLLTAIVAYVKEYKSMAYNIAPEHMRRILRDSPSFTDFYISSWGSLPSCFVGLVLANIQFALTEKKVTLSEYKWFVCLHYAAIPILFTWPLTGILARGYSSPLFHAAYIALDRPIFCIILAINILGAIHIDSPSKKLCSWSGWHAMARMSLTVMMLHWCVNITIRTSPTAYATSVLDIIVDWTATNFITYVAAVPITVLVEIPFRRFLESLLF